MKAYPMAIELPKSNTIKSVLFGSIFTLISFFGYSQELVFKNGALDASSPVTAGKDGAIYRFPKVTAKGDVDALVTIIGRSSSLVTLGSIDYTGSGYGNALQPQVNYNGGTTPRGYSTWYMEFDIQFVVTEKKIPVSVETADVTALDIDGNSGTLAEYATFYSLNTYKLETRTQLTVSNVNDQLVGYPSPVAGKKFLGPTANYTDIDTRATRVMVTNTYKNVGKMRIRAGGESQGRDGAANRMYSFWFKSFTYDDPNEGSLPAKLTSFTATKKADKKVALDWITAQEINVSHFVVERSTDGKNFDDAGIVFAAGNSNEKKSYKFTDEQIAKSGIVYYRLNTVDVDGRSEKSMIRVVRTAEITEEAKILTYPNPVVNELRVQLPVSWQQKQVSIEVFNSNGQVVKRSTISRANQTETVVMSDLTSGVYIVKATNGTDVATQRIAKAK